MCPIDAQRLRLVCLLTSRTPSRYFSKSRLESPWPWVTMQKRCAPAASAARACSSTCSGFIIACIGVSASAKRDCAQKPQSSAQPPDLAFTSEHMSVESANRSSRTRHARSTSASISPWSSISPSCSASSGVISGAIDRRLWSVADGLPVAPARGPFLGEGPHPLAHVLRRERGVSRQLGSQLERDRVQLRGADDPVAESPGDRCGRVDVAAEEEQLARS